MPNAEKRLTGFCATLYIVNSFRFFLENTLVVFSVDLGVIPMCPVPHGGLVAQEGVLGQYCRNDPLEVSFN
jgi:hypothetical protein